MTTIVVYFPCLSVYLSVVYTLLASLSLFDQLACRKHHRLPHRPAYIHIHRTTDRLQPTTHPTNESTHPPTNKPQFCNSRTLMCCCPLRHHETTFSFFSFSPTRHSIQPTQNQPNAIYNQFYTPTHSCHTLP